MTTVKTRSNKKLKPVVVCQTCGAITAGHLCTPVITEKACTCEHHENIVGNPRDTDIPESPQFAYSCHGCDRLAVNKIDLCMPVKL